MFQKSRSTATVYRYFSTKTGLLLATLRMLWTEIARELSLAVDDAFRLQAGYGKLS